MRNVLMLTRFIYPRFLLSLLCILSFKGTVAAEDSQPSTIVQVSAGFEHSLILKSDGSVWSMGGNQFGQLGDGTNEGRSGLVRVVSNGATQVVAGGRYSLMVMDDGSLWGTGHNQSGQLGNGSQQSISTFVRIIEAGVLAVSANHLHTVVLKDDGSVWTSGYNASGQLGNGTNEDSSMFLKVVDSGVIAISAGGHHSLLLFQDGTVQSAGRNNEGQLGNGTKTSSNVFAAIGFGDVSSVISGFYHSHFIKNNGSVWSCGENSDGQLGDGSRIDRSTPVLAYASSVSSGSTNFDHSLFVLNDGTLIGMGSNDSGQLGLESSADVTTPIVIPLTDIVSVDAGRRFSLILMEDNSLWGSGAYSKGQLGDRAEHSQTNANLVIAPVLRGSDFDNWLATYFTIVEIESMGENSESVDFDHDGHTNHEERELGLDPSLYASRQWIEARLDLDKLVVTFHHEQSNYTHEFVTSMDLENWISVDSEFVESGVQSIRYSVPISGSIFYKARSIGVVSDSPVFSLSPSEFAFIMIGQTFLDSVYTITSPTRFSSDGADGDWVYTKTSATVGTVVFTYDDTDNDPAKYREVLTLTFIEQLTGAMTWQKIEPDVETPAGGDHSIC